MYTQDEILALQQRKKELLEEFSFEKIRGDAIYLDSKSLF